MRKTFLRFVMTCIVAVLAVNVSMAAVGIPTSGFCGDSDDPEAVQWSFNMSSGTLTISGEGAMADFASGDAAPWYDWQNDITNFTVEEGVTRIGNYACFQYPQLTSVSMASSVLSIGDYAFCNTPLANIQPLTDTTMRVREVAAPEVTVSALPEGVMSIGAYALSTTALTNLTLPSMVNYIGESALSYNPSLATLTCLGTMTIPWFDSDILEGCNALTAIYVPEAALDSYQNADCWSPYTSLLQVKQEGGEEEEDDPTIGGSVTVEIGKASYSHDLPITASHCYSLSQQVFTADEINQKAGNIWSLAFNTESGDLTRNLTVYVTKTNQSWLSSGDWQTVTEDDCVFSGDVKFTSGQWNSIDFDKPFKYDGKSNLVVTVNDNTGKKDGSFAVLANYVFYGSGQQCITAYDEKNSISPMDQSTIENARSNSAYSYKSQLRFTFEDYPQPAAFAVNDIADTEALVQCSLRGDATAWNLRYRKVAAEGEEEQRWVQENDLTSRSFTLEGLTPATQYEVQVQAIFDEDNQSEWKNPVIFTTSCCPLEEQADLIYALNSNYSDWFNFAVQIMDITNEKKPVEVAYLHAPTYELFGGSIPLCCGHKYQVNWIYDADHANVNNAFSFALYLEPGDLLYSMARGEAPEETAELTTFVMDCTPYCAPKPQNLTVTGTTFESASISFISETRAGEVVYSTEADFDPDEVTPTSVEFTALSVSEDLWGGTPDNASLTLTGLEPLTEYYVRVRSVCVGESNGRSRWSDPIKVTTGSRYDAPTQVIAKAANSRTENLSWGGRGNEKAYNLYYRKQAQGTPVDIGDVQTFGGGTGKGFDSGSWGEGIWSSYGDRPFSNTLFVGNIPAGSSFGFNAGNGKTGGGAVNFFYGMKKKESGLTPIQMMKKLDRKSLNDADRAARIKELEKNIWVNEQSIEGLKQMLADGTFSQEEYDEQLKPLNEQLTADKAELEELKSLPTDDEKLARMKELETTITNYDNGLNIDITKEERDNMQRELNELRVMTAMAENPHKNGFTITNENPSPAAQVKVRRAPEIDAATYVFFIRHSDPNGVLLVKDLTITPPDQMNDWILIPNVKGTNYTLTGLEPNTAYEVMVEPIYEDGNTGVQSPITVFTTIGEETDPVLADFSVSEEKKVNFSHGNLRYQGDIYEGTWSMAKQQYEILGDKNVEESHGSTYPASPLDLFCWSTTNNYFGVTSFYYYDDEDALPKFQGDFADWGENPALIADLGTGWSTLTKEEWNYLLNERENAAQLRSFAIVAGVKGLVLLPDEWNAPDGMMLNDETTAEQWAAIEQTGAVFLPAAGQLTTSYEDYNATTTFAEAGNYWMGTPSGDESGTKALVLSFTDTDINIDADLSRRTHTAVRLVKEVINQPQVDKTALNEEITTASEYYNSIKDNNADVAAKLKSAIDEAQVVTDKVDATQEEVDAAKETLNTALQNAQDAMEIATGIRTPGTLMESKWHTLDGRPLNGKPIQKGIYIYNDIKVVVQ
jgi:uncharacterized coiled-coil protein SlyX